MLMINLRSIEEKGMLRYLFFRASTLKTMLRKVIFSYKINLKSINRTFNSKKHPGLELCRLKDKMLHYNTDLTDHEYIIYL
jgi:hypothetical protein